MPIKEEDKRSRGVFRNILFAKSKAVCQLSCSSSRNADKDTPGLFKFFFFCFLLFFSSTFCSRMSAYRQQLQKELGLAFDAVYSLARKLFTASGEDRINGWVPDKFFQEARAQWDASLNSGSRRPSRLRERAKVRSVFVCLFVCFFSFSFLPKSRDEPSASRVGPAPTNDRMTNQLEQVLAPAAAVTQSAPKKKKTKKAKKQAVGTLRPDDDANAECEAMLVEYSRTSAPVKRAKKEHLESIRASLSATKEQTRIVATAEEPELLTAKEQKVALAPQDKDAIKRAKRQEKETREQRLFQADAPDGELVVQRHNAVVRRQEVKPAPGRPQAAGGPIYDCSGIGRLMGDNGEESAALWLKPGDAVREKVAASKGGAEHKAVVVGITDSSGASGTSRFSVHILRSGEGKLRKAKISTLSSSGHSPGLTEANRKALWSDQLDSMRGVGATKKVRINPPQRPLKEEFLTPDSDLQLAPPASSMGSTQSDDMPKDPFLLEKQVRLLELQIKLAELTAASAAQSE